MIAASYDLETLHVLNRVFDEAWIDVQAMLVAPPLDANAMQAQLAKRIMAAADHGERDPRRLKLIAMGAIES